ncbi:MAG: pilus assembly protein N-terminal domain-containing protein [Hyphomicrobium sp.]|jgi:hypothetical protein|uniref:pilus assembly protein N-terminal domain-containing protein n=1 Tax=Hyphomicrobium sp. CS1BSMeth3 TaxID=1892844 RepID=UPI00086D8233|nr:pilus assembly protein N-terminal domain-containing protein [Hyphomicrobium sp. CS1BSMeth3]MBN9259657.1 pilus assembly protein N-terminal domain-containing protein [Hyphomicrobium sp.]MBN9263565.1 pilus assembly protein N-terminal domain-containing protein [Hyphomicrobium sp.]MBN9278546.1 pilus assembly protein N-terminal domain-containing protein [Hyphomicrobium sp.]ODT25041.1 MAG: hypothetical protein ABS54_09135 [Hyphomicrobium sp. SCN 65-11]
MTAKAVTRIALAGLALAALAPTAVAGDLVVKYDQSQLLRIPRPVASIIIGNPSIADVTVQTPNLLVVTGKTFGITNVIALDSDRNVIQDQRVVVVRDGTSQVSLYRGLKRETYNCAPQCNPSLMAGDDPKFFGEVRAGFQGKTQFSDKAADDTGGSSN